MDILFINMEKDVDRYNKITSQLSSLKNFKLTKINGVNGRNIDKNDKNLSWFCSNFCTPGMIGCFMSHFKAWNHIVNNNIKEAIIFEDDIILDKKFEEKFFKYKKHFPKNSDIILLGCTLGCQQNNLMTLIQYFHIPILGFNTKYYTNYYDNNYIIPPLNFTGLYSYYITQNSARKLINNFKKVRYHIDTLVSKNTNINIYYIKDIIVKTNTISDESTITNSNKILNYFDQYKLNNTNIGWILGVPIIRVHNTTICYYHSFLIIIGILIYYFIIKHQTNN